jgi:hypothetical protein
MEGKLVRGTVVASGGLKQRIRPFSHHNSRTQTSPAIAPNQTSNPLQYQHEVQERLS